MDVKDRKKRGKAYRKENNCIGRYNVDKGFNGHKAANCTDCFCCRKCPSPLFCTANLQHATRSASASRSASATGSSSSRELGSSESRKRRKFKPSTYSEMATEDAVDKVILQLEGEDEVRISESRTPSNKMKRNVDALNEVDVATDRRTKVMLLKRFVVEATSDISFGNPSEKKEILACFAKEINDEVGVFFDLGQKVYQNLADLAISGASVVSKIARAVIASSLPRSKANKVLLDNGYTAKMIAKTEANKKERNEVRIRGHAKRKRGDEENVILEIEESKRKWTEPFRKKDRFVALQLFFEKLKNGDDNPTD